MIRESQVLVIGEALLDIVVRGASEVRHPGGSPANVAYGLARLDVPTTLLTWFGRDAPAEILRSHLESAGVRIAAGSDGAPRTSTAIARIRPDGSAEYEFDLDWAPPATAPLDEFTLVHTGSIASFLSPGAAAVREMLARARSSAMITYDPNIRPDLVGSHAAAVRAFEATIRLADVVKLSDEDASWLYPGKPVERVLDDIIAEGATLAVATMGSAGSALLTPTASAHVPAQDVDVVDTIGAGDAYMSALIAGVVGADVRTMDDDALRSLGEFASIVASLTIERPGAAPPTRSEIVLERARQPQQNPAMPSHAASGLSRPSRPTVASMSP
jgi:fructokinase